MRTIKGYRRAINLSRAIKKIRRTTHQLQHFLAFYRLIRVVQPYTMVDRSRLIISYGLAREVVPKRIIELRSTLVRYKGGRTVYASRLDPHPGPFLHRLVVDQLMSTSRPLWLQRSKLSQPEARIPKECYRDASRQRCSVRGVRL
jgi:hypothetical protein